jgi:toxin FitB
MYLLDTTIPSELRKGRGAHPNVVAWFDTTPIDLQYLSVVTILEMRVGALQRERDDPPQARSLHRWLDTQVLPNSAGRILPVSLAVAERCAPLHIPTEREDLDMLIASTALTHDFSVVTRNVRHFRPTGVRIVNPWELP